MLGCSSHATHSQRAKIACKVSLSWVATPFRRLYELAVTVPAYLKQPSSLLQVRDEYAAAQTFQGPVQSRTADTATTSGRGAAANGNVAAVPGASKDAPKSTTAKLIESMPLPDKECAPLTGAVYGTSLHV